MRNILALRFNIYRRRRECESKIKNNFFFLHIQELLKIVGMRPWMLWLGWFCHALITNIISIVCIVILMKVPLWGSPYPPIEYCNYGVFAVFLLLYCIASITFCFMISSLFTTRKYSCMNVYLELLKFADRRFDVSG